ncbi:MAG: hypothetical protein K1X66_08930 [Verrucomicrobiae bacterium]|nr:hypothetical protein [Verrucomicrobiae bacterium]
MASPTLLIRGASRFAARIGRLEARAARTGQRMEALADEVTTSERRLASALGGSEIVTAAGIPTTVAELRVAHALTSRNHLNTLKRHVKNVEELAAVQADEAKHLARLAESSPAAQRNPAALDRANRIAEEVKAFEDRKDAIARYKELRDIRDELKREVADNPRDFVKRRQLQQITEQATSALDEVERTVKAYKTAKANADTAIAERIAAVEARARRAHLQELGRTPTIDDLAEEAAVKAERLNEANMSRLEILREAAQATSRAEEAALADAAEVITQFRRAAEAGDIEARRQIRRITDMSQRVAFEKAKEAEARVISIDEINREGLPQLQREPSDLHVSEDDVQEAFEEFQRFARDRDPLDDRFSDLVQDGLTDRFTPEEHAMYQRLEDASALYIGHNATAVGRAQFMERASEVLRRAAAVEEAAGGLTSKQAVDRLNREMAVRLMADHARNDIVPIVDNLFAGRYDSLSSGVSQAASQARFAARIHYHRDQLVHASLNDLKKIDEALLELHRLQEEANDLWRTANKAREDLEEFRKAASQSDASETVKATVDTKAIEAERATRVAENASQALNTSLNEANQSLDRVIQSVAGVTVVAIATEADAAQESVNNSREHFTYAEVELHEANEGVVAAEAALDNFSGSEIERLELEARLASALEIAEEAKKLCADAETSYVDARVDKQLEDKETAEEKAAAEAEARGEAYFASTAEGMAWEGMKWVGKGALTGLHYAEEGVAYASDAWGRYGMGLPVDVGHGSLDAQDAVIEHVVLPVAVATYEKAKAVTNSIVAPLREARQREEKFAAASEIKDQDEIDKLAPAPTLITIPDTEPPAPALVAEAKRKKRSDEAWAKIEEKAQQSLEKNMSLIEDGEPEEQPNMSVDPSLASQSSTSVPKV